ncbi:MAG: dUTP diphosphatase [Chitinophagaceae bacterium]|nr:MAG: dUTP diphosphatase [Chitinophagaceae bacterium]
MSHNYLEVKVINESGFELPEYQTPGSAGLDLRACINEKIELLPLQRTLIPVGLKIELPDGYEAQIRPRSGLALKKGITLLNSPGTIDSDYRGEIKVILINLSGETQEILPGERIAQMVIAAYTKISWKLSKQLNLTNRNAGGFGHTGI